MMSATKKLFDESNSESENEVINEFHTNENYAKVYNKFRQKELLKKLKDRQHDSDLSDSSSESDISDEDVYDPKFDEEFLKTLASLKSKDPSIYDKNLKFFENFDGIKKDKNKNDKSLTLKDYERKVILEKGGKYEDDDDDNETDNEEKKRPLSPSYVQEQEQLKKEIRNIINDSDNEEEEFGGIFKKRNKTKEEQEKEDEDFLQWLSGKKDNIDEDKKKTLNPLKQYWNNPNLSKEEKFLRDYVLNNGYINRNSENVPTYDEIVAEENLSEDEEELEKQLEFEHKYNFRFEEPDKEFIKRYPRTIENSVRIVDDKRKLKRHEVKERKKQEKEQKMQELEMLKELKRKEIEEKIEKLKEVTGNDELPFKDDDLDEDFDPEAHDRRMREIFNDEYYEIDEGEEKPECPDIEDLKVEDWDNYDPKQDNDIENDYEPHCEDDDFIMDCDYEANSKEQLQNELIDSTKSKKKRRKRRNRFMEMIETEKPAFNPEDEKTYAEYIDEYYKMDCEDIIGDIPCRFKYVETVPNDFGLTIEEILLAKNKELNQWASLKKAVQLRPEHIEKNEVKLYKMKAQNLQLKKKIFRSLYGSSSEDEGANENENKEKSEIKVEETPNDSKKKSKKTKPKTTNGNLEEAEDTSSVSKKKSKQTHVETNKSSPSKGKNNINKNKSKKCNEVINCIQTETTSQKQPTNDVQNGPMNKKKKNKKNKSVENANNSSSKVISSDKNSPKNAKSNDNKKRKQQFDNSTTNNGPNPKKKKFNMKSNSNEKNNISEERLKAYGLNPRKFYKKQKFLNQNKNFKNQHNKKNFKKNSS